MKNIILTIDYEVFLGPKTGDVESCMIKPTEDLADILNINSGKMTIFLDILHYYKLLQLQNLHAELKVDIDLIEEQVLSLAKDGHDIQLHIHPHWLDAIYENKKWNFIYNRFNIQSLSDEYDITNIETIVGCISISKNILETLIRNVNPSYKVTTFRAGGYLLSPFSKLRNSLLNLDILIDTSICPGIKYENEIFSYNYSNYPDLISYNFSADPKEVDTTGSFTEVPIKSVKIPIYMNLYFTFLRHFKYGNLKYDLKGLGSGSTTKHKTSIFTKLVDLFTRIKTYQFTTDGNFKELFYYMFDKVENNSTLILHPKLLNTHTLNLLKKLTRENKVKFCSIDTFINHKNI